MLTAAVWHVPPGWQTALDVLRIVEIVGSIPMLFFTGARVVQAPTPGYRALAVSSVLYVLAVMYVLLDHVGQPATPQVALVFGAVAFGLWGSWQVYRGGAPRDPQQPRGSRWSK